MSDYSDIATALGALLNGVTGIGVVHTRQRWSNDWSTFFDVAKTQVSGVDQLRFWMIRRGRVQGEAGERFGQIQRTHTMTLVGALRLDDSTDSFTTFQSLVDAVMTTVDASKDLGLSYVTDYGVGPCNATTIAEEVVAGVLCHVVEIEVPVVTEHDAGYS